MKCPSCKTELGAASKLIPAVLNIIVCAKCEAYFTASRLGRSKMCAEEDIDKLDKADREKLRLSG